MLDYTGIASLDLSGLFTSTGCCSNWRREISSSGYVVGFGKGFSTAFVMFLRVAVVPRSNLNRKHKAAASFLSLTPFILHSSFPSRCCFHFFYFFATRLKLTAL